MLRLSSRLLVQQRHRIRNPKCEKQWSTFIDPQQQKRRFPQAFTILQIVPLQRRQFHDDSSSPTRRKESNVLICGDGDLSYSASIAQELAQKNIHLTATVLESKHQHEQVFRDSIQNSNRIERYGHVVRFETDATQLGTYHDLIKGRDNKLSPQMNSNNNTKNDDGGGSQDQGFDRIQFNFPHWQGKTNTRHNRKLLSNFFASAVQVLHPQGEVHVALMDHQGGAFAEDLQQWKMSWMPALYAAESANLLLTNVIKPYTPNYKIGGYRWKDRAFHTKGSEAHLYIFTKSQCPMYAAPQHLQLYCHYQLLLGGKPYTTHVTDMGESSQSSSTSSSTPPPPPSVDEINNVKQFIQDRVPQGWRVQVCFTKWIPGCQVKQLWNWIALYHVAFFGQDQCITRSEADKFRLQIEDELLLRQTAPTTTQNNNDEEMMIPSSPTPSLVSRSPWMISQVFPQSLQAKYNALDTHNK